ETERNRSRSERRARSICSTSQTGLVLAETIDVRLTRWPRLRDGAASNECELFSKLFEDLEDSLELLVRVRRHVARPDQISVRRHRRGSPRVREHPALEQPLPELKRLQLVADDDRDDRRLSARRVESEPLELVLHAPGDRPQPAAALRLVLQDVE